MGGGRYYQRNRRVSAVPRRAIDKMHLDLECGGTIPVFGRTIIFVERWASALRGDRRGVRTANKLPMAKAVGSNVDFISSSH